MSRWLTLALAGALFLSGCDKEDQGVACDVCGQGVPLVSLFEGVPSTCARGLHCVAATVFLPGPGVCVSTTTSTTCPGIVPDSTRQPNQCTYTPGGAIQVRCGLP